jgi:hypothetical protein
MDLTGRFYATRHIKAGEEITIQYIESLDTLADRQASLAKDFCFKCTCASCSLPPHQVKVSDASRTYIKMVIRKLGSSSKVRPSLLEIERAIRMAEEGKLENHVRNILYLASAVLIEKAMKQHGPDMHTGRAYLSRAVEMITAFEGADSHHLQEIALVRQMFGF